MELLTVMLERHRKGHFYRERYRRKKLSRRVQVLNGGSDLEWFASSPRDLELFREKYVAIYNRAIIGWGDSVREALNAAKALDIHSDPLVAYIEPSGLQAF